MPECRISNDASFIVQLVVASLLAAIAFRLDNQGVLTGSMLVSPIGGVLLSSALGKSRDSSQLVHLYIPIAIGVGVGMLPGAGVSKTLQNSGAGVMSNLSSLIDSLVVAVTCGILFPMLRQIPEVGVDIATQLLPPLVSVGFCAALALRRKLQWSSSLGSLLLFLTYLIGLYTSTSVTYRILCKRRLGASD